LGLYEVHHAAFKIEYCNALFARPGRPA
jgi:hypothetical protein